MKAPQSPAWGKLDERALAREQTEGADERSRQMRGDTEKRTGRLRER